MKRMEDEKRSFEEKKKQMADGGLDEEAKAKMQKERNEFEQRMKEKEENLAEERRRH